MFDPTPFTVIIQGNGNNRCYRFGSFEAANKVASILVKGEESFVFGPNDSNSIAHHRED